MYCLHWFSCVGVMIRTMESRLVHGTCSTGFGILSPVRTIHRTVQSLEFLMRGAGLRLNIDVRRLWRCAACGAERKVGAEVTTVDCQCAGRPTMKLVEGMRRERPLKELTTTYMEFEFEPGELAPPRPRNEEAEASTPNLDTKLESEVSDARVTDAEHSEAAPAAEDRSQRPAASQRPPRQNERRGDRGPRSHGGPQGRQENRSDNRPRRDGSAPRDQQPRRDQPPRREQRDPQTPRPENTTGENPIPADASTGAPTGSRRNRNRRGNRGGKPSAPGDSSGNNSNSSFGEGISVPPPPSAPE